jgi:hypothetical protein
MGTSAICPQLMQKTGLGIKSSSQGRRKRSSSRAYQLLQTHRDRQKPYFKDAGIELICRQFSKFVRAVREEPQFKMQW